MNIILWLIVGGVIGWIASIIMGTNGRQGALLNVAVGIVGALLAGLILSPMLGSPTINQGDFSLSGLVISLLGAILLLGVVNLARRGAVR